MVGQWLSHAVQRLTMRSQTQDCATRPNLDSNTKLVLHHLLSRITLFQEAPLMQRNTAPIELEQGEARTTALGATFLWGLKATLVNYY
jgi:hypothetical protein